MSPMTDAGATDSPSKRSRWPWLLMMLGITAAAGTVAALRGRRSTGPMLVDEPAEQRIAAAPQPRSEQKETISHPGR